MITYQHAKAPNILGFRLDGAISPEEFQAFIQQMHTMASQHGKIRLYAEVVDFNGWKSLRAFVSGILSDLSAIHKIEMYALITDPVWMARLDRREDVIPRNLNIRIFDIHEKAEALRWLQAPRPT